MAQAQSALAAQVRFPGEDGGKSLAEMAQRDLDAALQLLADRAQYITGASGAAIALRRDGRNDMLCRASTGTNAPELGALLSTEFGLSGESVRTRQPLRCDDAERDARVNHEVCRQLGIASVVVMPVVNDDQVLGVFELFSGKAHAFGERDLSAVQRLSEMVETAVRLAHATETLPRQLAKKEGETAKPGNGKVQQGEFVADLGTDRPADKQEAAAKAEAAPEVAKPVEPVPPAAKPEVPQSAAPVAAPAKPEAPPVKKPLFWSAAQTVEAEAAKSPESEPANVPPVLRGLRKCLACGFPVSAGRTLCVECEEKKWRGQLRQGRTSTTPASSTSGNSGGPGVSAAAPSMAKAASAPETSAPPPSAPTPAAEEAKPTVVSQALAEAPKSTAAPDFVLSAGVAPSPSWLAANKYIIGVLVLIAAVAAAVFFLR